MVFQFNDGSALEESVVFTEQDVYSMKSYHASRHGPAFTEDVEISLEAATGSYQVTTTARKDGHKDSMEGTLELPADVYNGMVLTIVKDLPRGSAQAIHYVAFTPTPRLIEVDLTPADERKILVGDISRTAIHYVLKPQLGTFLKLFARLTGRNPPDEHVWIVADEVPAFVRFEGPLYPTGPVWRIETTSPRLAD